MKDIDGKDNRFLISLDSIIIVNKTPQLNDKNVFDQKQNKTIDNEIVTPNKLDAFYQLDLEPISIKLNYRCKEGTVEDGSFSCGKTPEEAKKNYEKQQKEKAPASKNNVPLATNFNTKDIVSRIKNGDKITKAEYDFILPYINGSANKTSESTTGSAIAKQSKQSKQLPAKQEKITTKSKLSAKEKDTISEYSGFKYAPINQYLFGKQLNLTAKQDAEIKQNINNLTNIINNNKINTSMKVYRGLTGQSKEEFLKMVKNVKPGNSFKYAGFMSTSPDKSIGERFATWGNKGKTVLLEIDLPKDSNAMDISNHTASKKYGETEILVAPGFELVLNKVEKNKGSDIYHLTYKQQNEE